jgi:peptidoglycan/xylan/chitin deacetylase (PgdA/CDA1 family)
MFMKLRKSAGLFAAIIIASLCGSATTTVGQQSSSLGDVGKEIAITIDDLPLNGPTIKLKRLKTMTSKLLAGLKKHGVPAVGFVNESLLYSTGETDDRIQLLREWRDAGVELGNHTFSHIGFEDHSISEF